MSSIPFDPNLEIFMEPNNSFVYNEAVKRMREEVFDFHYLFSMVVNGNILRTDS